LLRVAQTQQEKIMPTWSKRLLAPPVFAGDEDKTRLAWLLNIILLLLLARAVLFRFITWFQDTAQVPRPSLFWPLTLLLLGMLLLLRRGHVRLAGIITVIGFWLSLTAIAVINGGIRSTGFRNYILPVLIAGLLFGRGAALATAGFSILAGLAMWLAEINGVMPAPLLPGTSLELLITHAISLLLAALLVTLATQGIQQSLKRARQELAERQQIELDLRASEERYRSLVVATAQAVWLTNIAGQVVTDSPSWRALTGQSAAEMRGEGWLEALHPADRARTAQVWARAVETRALYETEYRIRTAAGVYRDFSVRGVPVLDEAGTIREWVGTCTDITERKHAENALRASEARWRTIFNDAAVGIALLDAEGRPVQNNPALQRMLGYTEEELRQMPCVEFTHPEDAHKDDALYDELIQGQRDHYQIEKRYLTKDGQVVWSNLIVSNISGENGAGQFVVGMAEDITERKRAQEQVSLLQTITAEVIATNDLSSALEVVLRRVCERTGWVYGQAWIPQPGKDLLACGPAWFSQAELRQFRAVSEGIMLPPSQGLPGRVWLSKQAAWVPDVTLDANFPRAQAAVESGLKAALALPILLADEVIAVIEFFVKEPLPEDKRLVEVITTVAAQLGLVIERKRAEGALRESQRRFSDTLTNLEMIAVMADANGAITFCNDYLLRLTGWKRQEAIGRNWFEMFLPEHEQERVRGILAEIPPGASVTPHFENEIKTRSGERRLVKWANTTLRDLDERVIGVAALGDDITERKRAEEALRASEERFSKAFNLSPLRMGIARIKDGVILDVSDRWLRETGFARAEIIGHPIFELKAWIGEEEHPKLRQVLEAGKPVRDLEGRIRTKTGEERVTLYSAEVIELGGEACLLWAANDITERKRAEEQLKATSERLRALTASLGRAREEEGLRIAREVHDELGSLLTGLRWELERVDKIISASAERAETGQLREKVVNLLKLTDTTISAVRRIASEMRPSILDDLGLPEAIEWQAQQFQAHTGIHCHCDCWLENPALTREQATALFRISQETLTNILRHAAATRVEISMEEQAGDFVLTISDNGKGITEEQRAGLHSLGLLGMRERARLVGGEITITGMAGKGTVVMTRVPITT
jgi:PAS domain S-box-containing protein